MKTFRQSLPIVAVNRLQDMSLPNLRQLAGLTRQCVLAPVALRLWLSPDLPFVEFGSIIS